MTTLRDRAREPINRAPDTREPLTPRHITRRRTYGSSRRIDRPLVCSSQITSNACTSLCYTSSHSSGSK